MMRFVNETVTDSMDAEIEAYLLKRRRSDGLFLQHTETFYMLLAVQTKDSVYDHEIYSRQLMPSQFEERGTSLTLLQDECSGNRFLAYIKQIPKDMTDIEDAVLDMQQDGFIDHVFSAVDDFGKWVYVIITESSQQAGIVREVQIPMYHHKFVILLPSLKLQVPMDAHLASCVFTELRLSRIFRNRFLRYLRRKHRFHTMTCDEDDLPQGHEDISAILGIPCLVEIHLTWPKQKIDYAWVYRIQDQVYKKVQLDETMAWLNTLGGGYSALGDYFKHHAVQAGRIAVEQLKIAIELGDPITAAKCRLFFAQSLMQCGYFKPCRKIIRKQYKFAVTHCVQDARLEAMCQGLMNRLKYFYSLSQSNKIIKVDSSGHRHLHVAKLRELVI